MESFTALKSSPSPMPSSACRSPSKLLQQPQLQLSEEQEGVMKDILDPAVPCVYVDGGAGTGKSYVIAEAVRRLKDTTALKLVHVVAPTGIAAENVGGRTIHSFFGIRQHYSDCSKRSWSRDLESAQCIIVDEISMVSAEMFDLMDKIARIAKQKGSGGGGGGGGGDNDILSRPFGGVKIICVGDLYQLLPVNKESTERCPNEVKSRGLVFNSSVWKTLEQAMQKFSLQTSMRHKSDPYFMESLNKIRNATMTELEFEEFRARLQQKLQGAVAAGGSESKSDGVNSDSNSNSLKVVHLFPTTTEVGEMNASELIKLTGSSHRFCNFRWQLQSLLSDSRFGCSESKAILQLKLGAQVMLTKNMNVAKPFLVNGSRGVVTDFYTTLQARDWITQKLSFLKAQSTEFSILKDRLLMQQAMCEAMMSKATYIDDKIEFECWPVVSFQNEEVMPILPLREKVISKRGGPEVYEMVFPLQLAWAITIHKSQGLTIDRVHVDFARTFSDGMIYTALSRVRTMDGLHVDNFQFQKLRCSREVRAFFDKKHPVPAWHEELDHDVRQVWEHICEESHNYMCPSCQKNSRVCEKWANGGVRPIFRKLKDQIPEPRWTELQEQLNLRSIDISILGGLLTEPDPVNTLRKEVPGITFGEAKKLFAAVQQINPPLEQLDAYINSQSDSLAGSPPKRQKTTDHAAATAVAGEEAGDCEQVYVLRLQQGKYYVGKTNNLKRRLHEHQERGAGCAEWTKVYPMLDTVPRKSNLSYQASYADSDDASSTTAQRTGDANAIERTETLYQIKLHGIENVRGAKWCSIELTEEQKNEVKDALRELEDHCFGCGAVGHLKRDCPVPTPTKSA